MTNSQSRESFRKRDRHAGLKGSAHLSSLARGALLICTLLPTALPAQTPVSQRTRVSIRDGRWYINDQVTYPGARAEGLLMNVRMVNSVFEDRKRRDFDAEANTGRFLAQIPDYAAHGVRGFTICLQGGMPGYEGALNSAFNPDGSLRESYLRRVRRVIDACDRQGLVVILGCFYQRQDQVLADEAAVRRGLLNVVDWIEQSGFRNVVLEIANEFDHRGFDHPVLRTVKGQVELLRLVKKTAPGLLVSTSGLGHGRYPDELAVIADFLLIHFNGTKVEDIPACIAVLKKHDKPIVCNEDDKQGETAAQAAELCVANDASWGLMLNTLNQYFPLEFRGAADDPAVYRKLKELTSTGSIQIKVRNRVLHRIDPRLFGQFMERASWGSEIGAETAVVPGTHTLRPKAKELIREMQIPIVRFPGGTDVDYIDWLDMIDNVPGRPGDRPTTTGHTGNQVTNNFGYDEFLRLCEELKMEPILVVNFRDGLLAKDGPREGAKHAAKLAAYCNAGVDTNLPDDLAVWPRLRAANGHPQPYAVKYFQIGNETWAFSRKVSHEQYLTALEAYIDAIQSVDPTIQFIVDGQPQDLAQRVHRRLGNRITYFAVHHYQPWQMQEVRRGDEQVDAGSLTEEKIWYAWVTLPQVDSAGRSCLRRSELQQARKLGYKVAMTEWNWNGWWGGAFRGRAALDSLFARGIGAAGILHAIMRQGDVVEAANQSMLIGDGWKIHAIWCDRHGKTPPFMVPSGQVTMLYSRYHGNQRLQIDVANMPRYDQPYRMAGVGPAHQAAYLDVLATRNEKTLYLHAINRHFDRTLTASIDCSELGERPAGKGTLHILEGRLNNAPAESEALAPARVREELFDITSDPFLVQLPRRTVTVVEVPLR